MLSKNRVKRLSALEATEQEPLINAKEDRCCRIDCEHLATSVCLSSKAALLALLWSFCVGIMFGLVKQPTIALYWDADIVPLVYFLSAINHCFYPLAGYMADNVFGRYKAILCSLKFLLVSTVTVIIPGSIFLVTFIYFDRENIHTGLGKIGIIVTSITLYFATSVSFVVFNANIIQFGMDQLHDCVTDHQSLYIHWYVWLFYLVQYLVICPWIWPEVTKLWLYLLFSAVFLVLSFVLTAAAFLITLCNKKWFLIQRGLQNPYRLVYKVTRFARKHKVPVQRSAFTYCEDEIPAGLDLGKSKYGGPFTTEEVENVKAFYGILKIVLSLGPYYFINYGASPASYWYMKTGFDLDYSNYSSSVVLGIKFMNTSSSLTVVMFLLLYLCCFRSLLSRFIPKMLKRIGIGIALSTCASLALFIADSAIHVLAYYHGSLKNIQCTLHYNQSDSFSDFDHWYDSHHAFLSLVSASDILFGFSNMFFYIALYEFLCAQSPQSMKGFLIGISFAVDGTFAALGAVFVFLFGLIELGLPSCGMLYFGSNVIIGVVGLAVFGFTARKYHYRQRDEICQVYRYAEEYYSNIQREE